MPDPALFDVRQSDAHRGLRSALPPVSRPHAREFNMLWRLQRLRHGQKRCENVIVETFVVRRPRSELATLQQSLSHEGRVPIRWAIVAVDGDEWVIEGARLCSRPST